MYRMPTNYNANSTNKDSRKSLPTNDAKKSMPVLPKSKNTQSSPTNYAKEPSLTQDTSQSLTTTFRDTLTEIKPINKSSNPSISNIELTTNKLKEAIILSEIIGEPKCKRRKRARYGY